MQEYYLSLLAVLVISLFSLIGLIALSLSKKVLEKLLVFGVAFAAGSLLGDVFFHLVPHLSQEGSFNPFSSGLVLAGFLLFFILEKFLKWRHCHNIDCQEHSRELGTMNLVADGLHNFIDGAIIAGSFLVSIRLGLATSLAVLFHEVPQEIGDFSILIYSGFSRKKALFFNFLSALTSILGVLVIFAVGRKMEGVAHFLLALTTGSFVYIAASGLIPHLHQEANVKKSFIQFAGLISGMVLMAFLV